MNSSAIVAVSVTASLVAGCTAMTTPAPPRRGPFAFHYAPALTEEQLAWYSQFDLLVTHDPLPAEQVRHLHEAGTKLVLYEWSVAFYESLAAEWQQSMISANDGLLNARPLTGGAGSDVAGAWYYDPADEPQAVRRAEETSARLRRIGYDGIFLDTTTVQSVHPVARAEYERRHPDLPYDAAFARFLAVLRRELDGKLIVTNQGFRSPEHYLPWTDIDVTESLITQQRDERFVLRPWNDREDPWNSTHFIMRNLIEPVALRYPHVRFAHLNYLDNPDSEAIGVVVAAAHLFGGEGFVAARTIVGEIDSIYFRDPGRPISDRIDHPNGMTSYRFFEHALIVVTAANEAVTIDACGETIAIPQSPDQPRAWFFDVANGCR